MKFEMYAPVIIPTLNRYVHFKRCLESIERCTGAENTDVYVGLDYPPSEKYVDGWKKIDMYLAEKEKQNCFNKLVVFRRDHNCGVSGPGSNYALLTEHIKTVSDRYISSEDDNEFSPNFLEYMNQGLELYKNDPNVTFVSAYTSPLYKGISKENTFFSYAVAAYGLGHWVNKDCPKKFSNAEIEKELRKSLINTFNIYFAWPAIRAIVVMIKHNHQYGDYRYTMYNIVHHSYVLYPTKSLSRNWGCDGSGVNSPLLPGKEKESIQTEKHFSLNKIPLGYPDGLKKRIFWGCLPKKRIRLVARIIRDFLYIVYFFCSKPIKNA